MDRLFVYGTLKNKKEDTHYIVGKMWNVGRFPAVKLDKHGKKITGQVMNVTIDQLIDLDVYEGCPVLYDRKKTSVYNIVSKESEECWIYEWQRDTVNLKEIDEWKM